MKIKLNLDPTGYKEKPTPYYGAIRNRLAENLTEITTGELIEAIQRGQSFTPQAMAGTGGTSFISQQLICADVDNTRSAGKDENGKAKKAPLEKPLTTDHALTVLAQHGITPNFMYYSFSNTSEWPRFRIVVLLDAPIANPATAADLTNRLIAVLNAAAPGCADTQAKDNARMFLGGRPGCVFYSSGSVTTEKTLSELPEPPKDEKPQPVNVNVVPYKPPAERKETENRHRTQTKLDAMFDRDKNSFDLEGYILQTVPGSKVDIEGKDRFINPCPICTHNGDFQVTGSIYHCHSASEGGGTGGSIIDYLMNKHGVSLGEAMDIFKFDIMGYSREEWNEAWREEKDRERGARLMEGLHEWREQRAQDAQEAPIKPQEAQDVKPQATGAEAIDAFLSAVKSRRYEPIPTGISDIDKAIGGGLLRQQLVILGAAPAAGKTALAQWIFEGMAERGTASCIYLNLEMSREQMIARSLSRIAARQGNKGITPTMILQGYKWTAEQQTAIERAADAYKIDIAPRFVYNPENASANLNSITEYIEAAAKRAEAAGKAAPIIVIDYLQLISGGDMREDPTSIIKKAVALFKDYAIKHNTTVFVIIAHNRAANSTGAVSMESGRDTSALEYSADLQLALTYTATRRELKEVGLDKKIKADEIFSDEYKERIREIRKYITLLVTKSRWGGSGESVELIFDGESMTYTQIDTKHGFTNVAGGLPSACDDWIYSKRRRK